MDEAWVQAARTGDRDAFNELVLKYQDMVYGQACWLLDDPDDAADVTQEAFLQAFRKLNSFQGGSFRAWVTQIALNAGYDRLRQRQRHPTRSIEAESPAGDEIESPEWLVDPNGWVEERVERGELSAAIQCALNSLPAEMRAVVILVDLLEMDYVEAASALQLPLGTVKSRLARARLRLRDRLASVRVEERQAALPVMASPTVLKTNNPMTATQQHLLSVS